MTLAQRKEWQRRTSGETTYLILREMNAESQAEKDIIHLKMIVNSIQPYSRWWRWGFVGSLKRAIRMMEKELKRKNEKDVL